MGLFGKTVPLEVVSTPGPVGELEPVARLCEDCGKWKLWQGDTYKCAGCRYKLFLDSQPRPSSLGQDCALCGVSEDSEWHTASYQGFRQIRQAHTGQLVSATTGVSKILATCHLCKELMEFISPAMGRELAEAVLDARLGQILRVTGRVPAEPSYNHSGGASNHSGTRGGGTLHVFHGVIREVLSMDNSERPLAAWEIAGYSTPGLVREPLWWILSTTARHQAARRSVEGYHRARVIPQNHESSDILNLTLAFTKTRAGRSIVDIPL